MSQPTMTVCACSDPWCRVNGCRIANAQRYGAQINYGPAYVVPNLHAECAKREEQLRAEVDRLRDESVLLRTGRDAAREYADRLEREVLYLRGERAAVVAWLRKEAVSHRRDGFPIAAYTMQERADAIERGEHRREEER